MTNSETQTEPRKASRKGAGKAAANASKERAADKADASVEPAAEAPAALIDERHKSVLTRAGAGLVLVGGWVGILQINGWDFDPPVLFLCTGWLAILLTARFLWNTGMTVAYDEGSPIEEEEFWKPVGPHDELLREKRALLKALKEIEFDHQMGKMSDHDAAELSAFYRSRAIEIIKALESSGGGDEELSVSEKIDRELKARLSLAKENSKGSPGAERGKAKAAKAGARGRAGGDELHSDDELQASADGPERAHDVSTSADNESPAARAEVGS